MELLVADLEKQLTWLAHEPSEHDSADATSPLTRPGTQASPFLPATY
jgi:hypothetical protein